MSFSSLVADSLLDRCSMLEGQAVFRVTVSRKFAWKKLFETVALASDANFGLCEVTVDGVTK